MQHHSKYSLKMSVKSALFLYLMSLSVNAAPLTPLIEKRGVALPFFYPEVQYETFTPKASLVKRSPPSDEEDLKVAKQELIKKYGLTEETLSVTESHRDSAGVLHVYVKETVNGIEIDNHNAAAHVQNGQLLAVSSSFNAESKKNVQEESFTEGVPLETAVQIAEAKLGAKRDAHPAKTVYLTTAPGDVVLAHQFQVRDDAQAKWFQVSVDTTSGELLQVVNYYNDLTIKALPFPEVDPTQGFKVLTDPGNPAASPKGWNSDGIH